MRFGLDQDSENSEDDSVGTVKVPTYAGPSTNDMNGEQLKDAQSNNGTEDIELGFKDVLDLNKDPTDEETANTPITSNCRFTIRSNIGNSVKKKTKRRDFFL